MNGVSYFEKAIEQKLLTVNTAYLAKVLSISGSTARLQPLHTYRAVGGTPKKASATNAVIPRNIKYKTETITYISEDSKIVSKTILVPSSLSVGDIVYVGVCDRDITNAKNGEIKEATARHHDVNDGVILRVL